MIYGIGIDIVKIERMKTAVGRWNRKFLERIFTENEILYAHKKKDPYPSLSVRFAAKEALVKAVGDSVPIALKEIEILNHEDGRPFINVSGSLRTFFDKNTIRCTHVSLSHEQEYGVACVVLEQ
ncbi:MAG: holo-[acyl-carrier-protein] synthase [Nitrospira bacterium HGW-Nitrospira-1]|nr:MAG: holo-[acyl-carrier-protein] synthase [Nitrospira bacterium HGW-Nitrospira-1]